MLKLLVKFFRDKVMC